jgi:hypothetical protein
MDDVGICNLALYAIGHTKKIAALNEPSDEAEACQSLYAQDRDEVFEAAQPFRRRSAPAALNATTLELGAVPAQWLYAYELPADALPKGLIRVLPKGWQGRQFNEEDKVPFDVEYDGVLGHDIVLTDELNPTFIYNARVEDAAQYPPTLCRAIADRMAVDLVPALRKDVKLILPAEQKYRLSLARATASLRRSVQPDLDPLPPHLAAFVRARRRLLTSGR